MLDAFWQATTVWRVITNLGSAGLMLPVLAMASIGLWQSQQKAAVRLWMLSLSLAVMITMATKILFLGWGLGIAFFDFTGISGHALLSTSVLPVFFYWLWASDQPRFRGAGAIFGLMLGAGVGLS